MTATSARHSSESNEHYSPATIVEAAREVLGGIDLDPASCAVANETVKAKRFFTREQDGLSQVWEAETCFLNPPGGVQAGVSLQKAFWQKLARSYAVGHVGSAIFICFSVEILQTTQVRPDGPIPLDFPICFPSRRIAYMRATERVTDSLFALFDGIGEENKTSLESGDQPPHASAFVFLPPVGGASTGVEAVHKFRDVFSVFGRCINL